MDLNTAIAYFGETCSKGPSIISEIQPHRGKVWMDIRIQTIRYRLQRKLSKAQGEAVVYNSQKEAGRATKGRRPQVGGARQSGVRSLDSLQRGTVGLFGTNQQMFATAHRSDKALCKCYCVLIEIVRELIRVRYN